MKVMMQAGMGRFMCHDPRHVTDTVPCDVVASAILLTTAATISKVTPPISLSLLG